MTASTSPLQQGRTGWTVWSHSTYARLCVVLVESVAVGATLAAALAVPVGGRDLVRCAVVIGLGLVAAEAARQVERRRRRFADTPHVNFSSVWTLAGAVLLSPALTAVVALALYTHLWLRCWRGSSGIHLSRTLFNAGNVIVSSQAAAWTVRGLHLGLAETNLTTAAVLGYVLVIAIYFVTNSGIAAATIALVRPDRTARRLLGRLNENILELSTLCLGMLAAMLLAGHPALVVLILLPLYALHRSALIRQFEHAATTDPKTGLLNSTAWHSLATAEFARARRNGTQVGILMIDLDYFRRINNALGHPTGDKALRAVAQVLEEAAPGDDLCGRFGGEEFVVMLPATTRDDVSRIADAICKGIFDARVPGIHDRSDGRCHQLSASIGAALFPQAGETLEDVLFVADLGLFTAKDAGRNQVRVIETTS